MKSPSPILLLVDWAAFIRFKRLIRQNPSWDSTFAQHVIRVLQAVVQLHAAVIWNPQQSHEAQLCGAQLPSHDLRSGHYLGALDQAIQPNYSSGGTATALDRTFALLEAGCIPFHLQ